LGETQRLTKVDFIAEMTDHYACALEEGLAKG
jgi:dGTP triphosphohydrolase